MAQNLHRWRTACGLVALLTAGAPSSQPCPPEAGRLAAEGWQAYRADSMAIARARFAAADTLCPDNFDAKVGLGYVSLRQDRVAEADSLFRLVTAAIPGYGDAWIGLTLATWRSGDAAGARQAAARAIQLAPDNPDIRQILSQIDPDWDRPGIPRFERLTALRVDSRTRAERFEVPAGDSWTPFYVKGVNLGVALPGKYPAEFPTDSATYGTWLERIAGMGANTVRLYTILPPSFYRALRAWNLAHSARPLRLLHGVWIELPPAHDFENPVWREEFRTEIRHVVDLLHGAARLAPRPGHAGGRYDADVSAWTLGYIIGREWEPFAVVDFDALYPTRDRYLGRWIETVEAPAMDRWMAAQCDYMLSYEVDTYNTIRAIAYANWPTLDPLTHPSESSAREEIRFRGLPDTVRIRADYDNDAIGVDAMLARATAENPAGWFASYHVYPYYPDLLLYESAYDTATSSEGRSPYFGYLRALKAHHAGVPLLIAEYGVPSSRGSAHWHPEGWSHGGHDEVAMARIDARLTREIRESGAAGAILFEWLDEWYKKAWITVDYEIPITNNRQWHNLMDPEQHYGVLGQYAGSGDQPVLGGPADRWRLLPVLQKPRSPGPGTLRIGSDESYVYLAADLGPGLDWARSDLMLALDTYRPDLGQRALPGKALRGDIGFEFLAVFRDSTDAELRVTPDYNQYEGAQVIVDGDDGGRFARRPVAPVSRADGRFDSMFVLTNRTRLTRDGRTITARGYNRGRLLFATEASTTLADWYYDRAAGLLELRLPWALLNVSDPSTTRVLFDTDVTGPVGTSQSDGFRVGLAWLDRAGQVSRAVPAAREGRWRRSDFVTWRWSGWTTPRYHARLKPVYDSMRVAWEAE
jgi:hypothetical protein